MQTLFRVYEFAQARRLYWYYQFCADQRQLPQSSILRRNTNETEEESENFIDTFHF